MLGPNGSGVFVTNNSTVALTNTILVNHSVGIAMMAGNTATLESTLWHGNTTADWDGTGTSIIGMHNYWGAPRFDADGYHLMADSAAIDRGVDAGVTTDIDGEARPFGLGYDLGADEVLTASTPHCSYLPIIMDHHPYFPAFNGDFERCDFTYWTHGGELAQTVQSDVACQRNCAALLGSPNYNCEGGVPVGRAWMQRTFAVPSTGWPVLSFCYRIMTHDHIKWTDGQLGDSFNVYVQNNLVLRDGYDNYPSPSPGCGSLQDLGWKYFSYDLGSYKGQDIQVRFENWNRYDGWYNMYTYVDAVQITD